MQQMGSSAHSVRASEGDATGTAGLAGHPGLVCRSLPPLPRPSPESAVARALTSVLLINPAIELEDGDLS